MLLCCGECYDGCCDSCCPSVVGHGARDCIFNTGVVLFFLAAALAIALPVAAYAVIRHPSITVEDAALTKFAVSTSPATALSYNPSLSLRVRNPNWAMKLKNTAPLEAHYYFDGHRFDRVKVADEGEEHPAGESRTYNLTVGAYVALGSAGLAEFASQRATGLFKLEVTVIGEVRYTARPTKCKLQATCPLEMQLASQGTAMAAFHEVPCKMGDPDKYC